jgi:hypothetical protein
MKTGRSKYLTKQAGEYLVAAELSRRGYIATTFTGNVPYYDIIAVDDSGGHVVVQVKAIAGKSWQFNATDFAEIEMQGQRQIVRCERKEPISRLDVCPRASRPRRFRHGRSRLCFAVARSLSSEITAGPSSPLGKPSSPQTSMSNSRVVREQT